MGNLVADVGKPNNTGNYLNHLLTGGTEAAPISATYQQPSYVPAPQHQGVFGKIGDFFSAISDGAGQGSILGLVNAYNRHTHLRPLLGAVLQDPSNQDAWKALNAYDPETAYALRQQTVKNQLEQAKQAADTLTAQSNAADAEAKRPFYGDKTVDGHLLRTAPNGDITHLYDAPINASAGANILSGEDPSKVLYSSPFKPDAPSYAYQDLQGPDNQTHTYAVDKTNPYSKVDIGVAPPKAGAKAEEKQSIQPALDALLNLRAEFKRLHELGALAGDQTGLGAVASAVGRSPVGQFVGAQAGDEASQVRETIKKNQSQLQQQLIKALPASATRTRFEQEILKQSLPDPYRMAYGTSSDVINQLANSFRGAVEAAVPASALAYLKAHPETRDAFDKKYGAGYSGVILGLQ